VGQGQSGAGVLHRHDTDAAAREFAEKIPVLLEAGFKRGHFEEDRPRRKEIRRAGEPGVESRKPFGQWLSWFEDERQQRASPKIHCLSGGHKRIHENRSVASSLTIYVANGLRNVNGAVSRASLIGIEAAKRRLAAGRAPRAARHAKGRLPRRRRLTRR
jgi:hypothetical protein